MGHPKLKRKTYSGPTHPWQKERIEAEKELLKEFGLKNKKEVWRISSLLRKYARQSKKLIALNNPQADMEEKQLLKKLSSLGLINETAKLEDVLTLTLMDMLNRRLQTLVYRNKLAKSIRQARQFITHGHILIGERKVTVPSYFVSKNEETSINFFPSSPLFDIDHPERLREKVPIPKVPKEDKQPSKESEKGSEKEAQKTSQKKPRKDGKEKKDKHKKENKGDKK